MIFAICLDVISGLLYIGSGDGYLSVWSIAEMNLEHKVNLNSKKIREIILKDDCLYIGCGDGEIKVMDRKKMEIIYKLSDHMSDFSVNCIGFTNNDLTLISGSRDGHLNIYQRDDLSQSFELTKRIPAHNYAIYDIAFSLKQNLFATASRDKSIKIWDSKTFGFVGKVDFKSHMGHLASVNSILWFDKVIVSTGDDRKIIVWETEVI